MSRARVAIVRTKPESVLEDYVRAFELGDGPRVLDKDATTIIKDNISWHYPFPSANTTPWQLEGVILALRGNGFRDVTCVQNKTEVTDAFKGEDLNGYRPIFDAYGIPVLFNFLERDMQWIPYKPKARMLALNRVYGDDLRIPDYFVGKNIVHLPTVKCHIYTTTTGAMKNAFGGLLTHKRHRTHFYIHETLVDLLAIQKEIHSGLFCLMDGTTAGNGTGPRLMKPIRKDVILASEDQVAVDAVAAKIMGFDPMSMRYIALAHDAGLGVGRPDEIEIVGDVDAAKENWRFEVGRCFHQFAAWITWFGPTRFLSEVLTRPPILYLGNFYSYFYHDVLHWRFKERRIYERWLADSEWGRLFRDYKPRRTSD
ncbi:MAG: DUF362 domain-containing protein [Vicinamibacteria bacterium]|nr:DUF362 domain-containing protein [Vicinamibacteria bacterium]